MDSYQNFAYGTVTDPPSPSTVGTTMTVTGGPWPDVPFNAVVYPAGANPAQIAAAGEIARVTDIGPPWVIQRAAEGPNAARQIRAGDTVVQSVTRKTITDLALASPADLPDLGLWLDASQLTEADDAALAAWPDLSGNDYDAAQATGANKPTVKTAVQNGLTIVRFTSSPQSWMGFSGAALDLLRNIPGCTVATAMRSLDAGSGSFGWFWMSNGASATVKRVALGNDTGTFEFYVSSQDDNAVQLSAQSHVFAATNFDDPALTWGMLAGCGTVDLALPFIAASASPNQGAAVISANDDPDPLFEDTASLLMRIGDDGSGNGVTGDLGELIVYTRALNGTERRLLLDYLCSKWALL